VEDVCIAMVLVHIAQNYVEIVADDENAFVGIVADKNETENESMAGSSNYFVVAFVALVVVPLLIVKAIVLDDYSHSNFVDLDLDQ
jgi:hypothetical protein